MHSVGIVLAEMCGSCAESLPGGSRFTLCLMS